MPRKSSWLVVSMVAAVLAVAGLAFWDEERESAAALEDFAQEQATLATAIANDLRFRLANAGVAPLGDLLSGAGRVERPNAVLMLVQPPDGSGLSTTDGRRVHFAPMEAALANGSSTLRLSREESAQLGLPSRMSMAGLAHFDAGTRGHWGVAVIASASRERDRERRARWRLILAVAIAGGLILIFGGFTLRNQRTQLQLSHELALTELARQRDERLERASQAATMLTLASGMAHELSTPLGVIVGRAEQLLPRTQGDERATRAVQAVLEQAERIREVIHGFLGLARGGVPTLREVAPADVVQGASMLVEHRFTKAGVKLTVALADPLPLIRGEPRLLEHALVNLLLNACDASSRYDEVKVQVKVDGSSVEFAVIDHGSGIASHDAARVTEPFFTTKPTGTGLGLAVTSEIIKTHRGTLTLTPASPGGTRAAFRIPLSNGESHA